MHVPSVVNYTDCPVKSIKFGLKRKIYKYKRGIDLPVVIQFVTTHLSDPADLTHARTQDKNIRLMKICEVSSGKTQGYLTFDVRLLI